VNYRRMRRRLLDRGAAAVTVAPVHYPDWVGAALVGFGPVLLRAGRAIRGARARSDHPIIVVGHSAGGIAARLAMSPHALDGRLASVAEAVGCLVTLGTPHVLRPWSARARHRGHVAVEALASTPGAWFAPGTAYLTVGSTRARRAHARPLRPWSRIVRGTFDRIVGPLTDAGGDGLVPAAASHLEGATQLTFEDVLHGVFGRPWYGDAEIIDRWWPVAVDLWRGALEARSLPGRDRDRSPDQR
jgi:hypothetical protein